MFLISIKYLNGVVAQDLFEEMVLINSTPNESNYSCDINNSTDDGPHKKWSKVKMGSWYFKNIVRRISVK